MPDFIGLMGNSSPLDKLRSDYNRYEKTTISYPSNLQDLAHLMMFNINVQEKSEDLLTNRVTRSYVDLTRQTVIREANGPKTQADPRLKGGFAVGDTSTPGRVTKRITTAIALYIPNTLTFDDQQAYKDTSILDEFGAIGTGIADITGSSTLGALTGKVSSLLGAVSGALAGKGKGTTGSSAAAVAQSVDNINKKATEFSKSNLMKIAGFSVNPMIEVLYEQPGLRKFQFDFSFAPRNRSEANSVREIIYQFRRHAAPEFKAAGAISGAFFTPPSEFDISFHSKTNGGFSENLNMPRISTCVLESINTNYTPEMFQTFTDGMPVNITLRLAFKELDIITRERIDLGF